MTIPSEADDEQAERGAKLRCPLIEKTVTQDGRLLGRDDLVPEIQVESNAGRRFERPWEWSL